MAVYTVYLWCGVVIVTAAFFLMYLSRHKRNLPDDDVRTPKNVGAVEWNNKLSE
jgi:hypothetical protein